MSFFPRARARVLLPNNLPNRAGAHLARLALCLFSSLPPFQFSPEGEREVRLLHVYPLMTRREGHLFAPFVIYGRAHLCRSSGHPLFLYNIICIHKYIYIYITWYVVVITENSNLMRFAERKEKGNLVAGIKFAAHEGTRLAPYSAQGWINKQIKWIQ